MDLKEESIKKRVRKNIKIQVKKKEISKNHLNRTIQKTIKTNPLDPINKKQ